MTDTAAPFVIWHFSDGKPGHDNQSRGLLRALSTRLPVQIHKIDVPPSGKRTALRHLLDLLRRRCIAPRHLPDPDLLIGTGHATHLPMLAARHARGGRVIVLMKPSLPLRCFDLCIVPRHDKVMPRANVFVTRGPLNVIEPAAHKLEHQGLILIGGPSKHYRWSDQAVLEQIEAIARQDTKWRWTLAGSRRTPDSLVTTLRERQLPNVSYVAARDTGPEWLPYRIAEAARIWVTEDSLSMIFEALSGGAAAGLLAVPRRSSDRVTDEMDRLIVDGLLTSHEAWTHGQDLSAPELPLNEAARCAQSIVEHFLRVTPPPKSQVPSPSGRGPG